MPVTPLPTQFTEPIQAKAAALEMLALGYSDYRVQRAGGLRRGTLAGWRRTDPLFADASPRARAEAPKHLWDSILDQAYQGNNRAAIDWLKGHGYVKQEPMVPIEFRGRLEHTGPQGQPLQLFDATALAEAMKTLAESGVMFARGDSIAISSN